MKATQWMGIAAALVVFALPVRAEEAKADDAKLAAALERQGPDGQNHFWERWNNLTPEQKREFLKKHPHFRERVANWLADRGDRRDRRHDRRVDRREDRRERRLDRRADRRERRLERRERRAERRERRQERRQERREDRREGRQGGR